MLFYKIGIFCIELVTECAINTTDYCDVKSGVVGFFYKFIQIFRTADIRIKAAAVHNVGFSQGQKLCTVVCTSGFAVGQQTRKFKSGKVVPVIFIRNQVWYKNVVNGIKNRFFLFFSPVVFVDVMFGIWVKQHNNLFG